MTQPTFTAFTSPYNFHHVPLAIPSISTFHALNLQMYQHQIQLANLNRAMQYQQFVVQQKNLENLFLSQQKQLQDYSRVQNIKEAALLHPLVDLHNDQIEDSRNLKVEEIIEVCSNTTSSSDIQQITSHDDQREVINDLLCYFLSHFGKTDPKDLHKQKMKYAHDPVLTQLFDVLIMKYKTGSKSREDMVRFVMRKSITWLRDQTRNKSSMSAKSASVALCQRYFEEESANKSDDELLSLLLPYKKNSRYPVVNSQFMKEIFGSKKFCQDYMGYLEKYVEIMEEENKKKIKQFTEFLVSCIHNNCLDKVLTYKRVPWLDAWVDASQRIAYELYELHSQSEEKTNKLFKTK